MKKIDFVATLLLLMGLSVPVAANGDPFPGISKGQEIPGTRVSSAPGESWESFNSGAGASHSCPSGSGRGMETNLNGTVSQSDDIRSYYCVKTWEAPDTISAWNDFNRRKSAAQAAAQAESAAWNAANPGKQKCVQWGPLTDPNGGVHQGGVCANPVELPAGSQVPSSPAGTVGEGDVEDAANSMPRTPSNPSDPAAGPSAASAPRGSGYPFTQVLEGQLATAACPAGFQAANGLIVDATSKKTFTECWPQNAWTAYQLSGDAWAMFTATGGTYDPATEIDRRAKIALLVARAKEVANSAAAETPGIERCSSWAGFGESGRECSYVFVDPVTQQQNSTNQSTTDSAQQDSSSAIEVELESVRVATSSLSISRLALSITPNESEGQGIAQLARDFAAFSAVQRTAIRQLPRVAGIKYTVKSMTKSVCQASTQRVRITRAGVCIIEVEAKDSAGNVYSFAKRISKN